MWSKREADVPCIPVEVITIEVWYIYVGVATRDGCGVGVAT